MVIKTEQPYMYYTIHNISHFYNKYSPYNTNHIFYLFPEISFPRTIGTNRNDHNYAGKKSIKQPINHPTIVNTTIFAHFIKPFKLDDNNNNNNNAAPPHIALFGENKNRAPRVQSYTEARL